MNSKYFFRFAASLVLTALLVSCATNEEQPTDERMVFIPEDESLELVFPKDGTPDVKQELVPGKVYLGNDIKGIFDLKSIQSVVNEDGHLAATVVGSTKPYSFWTWLWHGEKERRIAYRFLWFNKDGTLISNLLNSVPGIRTTLPGDPLR